MRLKEREKERLVRGERHMREERSRHEKRETHERIETREERERHSRVYLQNDRAHCDAGVLNVHTGAF